MKKLFFSVFIFLFCMFILVSCKETKINGQNQEISSDNVVSLETESVFTENDLIEAFDISDLNDGGTSGTDYPVLNKVDSRTFNYLDGTLLTYIFYCGLCCDKGLTEARTAFADPAFKLSDESPVIYQASNVLLVYISEVYAKDKIQSQMEELLFLKEAEAKKGLSSQMIRSLSNLGYDQQEILDMPQKDIDRILAPGSQSDGAGFDFSALSEDQRNALLALGIDQDKSMILFNLGYEYEDMAKLSEKELDFIFPNTELIANLEMRGISKSVMEERLFGGLTYKDIIKEALCDCGQQG